MTKREGWAEKLNWSGVTDTQQAQYPVRSLLCFAERDIKRAYLYYFNDDDKASVHASSGLTRNFELKPNVPGKLLHAERMALTKDGAERLDVLGLDGNLLRLTVTENPSYLLFDKEH